MPKTTSVEAKRLGYQDAAAQLYADAAKSLIAYRRCLVNAGRTDKDIDLAPARFHFEWSNVLLHGQQSVAYEAFRESGKSEYVLKAFPLYCLTFPDPSRSYIAIIQSNAEKAWSTISELSIAFQSNPLLCAGLEKIYTDSKSCFYAKISGHKIRIEGYGKGTSIRGASHDGKRPQLIIMDDVQDPDDLKSETTSEGDWKWFLSDIKFLGRTSRIFFIGNNLGERCIIERLITAIDRKEAFEDWKAFRQPAIIEDANGKKFSAWEERHPLVALEKEREEYAAIGEEDIWLKERMCISVSEANKVFDVNTIPRYSDLPDGLKFFCTLDPASSKATGSCYRAFVVVGVTKADLWYIADVSFGRWDSDELLDEMFRIVKKWGLRSMGIEKGQFQQVLEPFLMKEMRRRNQLFEVTLLEHAKMGTKLERIKMLSPRYRAGLIMHPSKQRMPSIEELESEMRGITKDEIRSKYVDVLDALANIEQLVKPRKVTIFDKILH